MNHSAGLFVVAVCPVTTDAAFSLQSEMFTPDERARLKRALIERARVHPAVAAAALVGSGAEGAEDDWSDIDLALGVAADADLDATIAGWTDFMDTEHGAVHYVDVVTGGIVFRVFLLPSTLQVDLSFWPPGELRAYGPRFRSLFGPVADAVAPAPSSVEHLAGMSWLYLLHARSSIARERPLQARHFLDGARDQILALACVIRGLPENDARGADELPAALREEALRSLPASTVRAEAERALGVLVEMLRGRIEEGDAGLAARLDFTLGEIGAPLRI